MTLHGVDDQLARSRRCCLGRAVHLQLQVVQRPRHAEGLQLLLRIAQHARQRDTHRRIAHETILQATSAWTQGCPRRERLLQARRDVAL